MADCFSKELELEGEYQVGEVVSPRIDLQVMSAAGQLTGEEIHEANASGDAEPERQAPAALVDIGATRSCLSGAQYKEMGQPLFTALCKGTVRVATGGDM